MRRIENFEEPIEHLFVEEGPLLQALRQLNSSPTPGEIECRWWEDELVPIEPVACAIPAMHTTEEGTLVRYTYSYVGGSNSEENR